MVWPSSCDTIHAHSARWWKILTIPDLGCNYLFSPNIHAIFSSIYIRSVAVYCYISSPNSPNHAHVSWIAQPFQLQVSKPRILNMVQFYYLKPRQKEKQMGKEKPQQGCTNIDINARGKQHIIRELSPAICNAVSRLSEKYPSIFNILRTGLVALM